jgi:signal transduction histidine kinase
VNRRFEELTRIRRAAIVGRTDYDLFPAGPADIIRHNDRLVVERNEAIEFEEDVTLPDGPRTFLSLKFPVPDPVTGHRGVGGISTDITERKRMQEQMRETQKLESLGVLAGGVAHDFNNLLTGILGNASIALESVPPENPARAAMEEVLEASERAAHLTRQMLSYAGKANSAVERLDLSRAVREIAGLVRLSIPRNVTLRLELAPDLPPVEADPGQLEQVVMNLVINGAEAVGENKTGTVVVTTGVQHLDAAYIRDHLRGEAAAPGRHVFLEVHDTGAGMDEATRSRIFDPFFTTKLSGRGLGLSAVRGIIRGHKGAIRVSSIPGMGTTFKILLPVAGAAVARNTPPEEAPETGGRGRILVVDDEEIVRRAAKFMLEHYGYTVLTAENGAQAVELLRRNAESILLVLLDYTMPVMGVEEALHQIRQVKPDIPVLLSSGYDQADVARRFTGTAIAGFIQKPYRGAKLAQTVRQVLQAA